MRNIGTIAVVLLVGFVVLKIVFGVTGGLIGILISLAWFAFKVLVVVGVVYWLLSVFSPETAKKMRDVVKGDAK